MGSYEDKKFGTDQTITGGREFTGDFSAFNDDGYARNFIINGNFDFFQRGTVSLNAHSTDFYGPDRFFARRFSLVAGNMVQDSSSVPPVEGAKYALRFDVTTADTTVEADNYTYIGYKMEGYDTALLLGKNITLSFWVRSPKTGTHCVSFANGADNRSYIAEYSINSANTWEYKEIPIYFDPTGTWEKHLNKGLIIRWCLMAGTNFQNTANTWHNTLDFCTSAQVNVGDNTANNFYLSQIMLNIGPRAAPFVRAGGSIAGELTLCQRYYEIVGGVSNTPVAHGVQYTTSAGRCGVFFRTTKRANPTVTTIGSSFNFDRGGGASSTGTPSYFFHSPNSVWMEFSLAGGTQGLAILVTSSSNSAVAVNAEL